MGAEQRQRARQSRGGADPRVPGPGSLAICPGPCFSPAPGSVLCWFPNYRELTLVLQVTWGQGSGLSQVMESHPQAAPLSDLGTGKDW